MQPLRRRPNAHVETRPRLIVFELSMECNGAPTAVSFIRPAPIERKVGRPLVLAGAVSRRFWRAVALDQLIGGPSPS
jgi:hypothetical protein